MHKPILLVGVLLTTAAGAQAPQAKGDAPKQQDAAKLAQKLTNPVADLVSIPFQFNWRQGVGPDDDLQLVLNIQPVVPIMLNKEWNLIGRFIVPVISQPRLGPDVPARTGLSDALLSVFLSPAEEHGFLWGAGPAFALPLTADPALGSGRWSAGPTAVGLYLHGPWTLVLLVNHLWSFATTGDLERDDVNQTFLQPAISYTTGNAWTVSVQSETTLNWSADSGEQVLAPINAYVSKLTRFGPFPMSVQAGGGYYIESPTGGPEWQLRLALTVLLPKPHEQK